MRKSAAEAARQASEYGEAILKQSDQFEGFYVPSGRWFVERTFSWLSRHWKLSKDHKYLTENIKSMMRIVMIKLMTQSLAIE